MFIAWLVIGIIILVVVVYMLIRLYIPFWSRQPVFHIYDLPYYFFSPRILSESLPRMDQKYVNMKNIIVQYGTEANKSKQQEMTMLLRNHYLRDKRLQYLPKTENIVPYLELNNVIILHYYYADTIIGTITIRPIECILDKKVVEVQYVDFLCVHKNHRKKGIAQQLIGTLYYYQRHNTPYKISLFKNEGKQRGIIPFAMYETYRVMLKKIPHIKLNPSYHFTKATKRCFHSLRGTILSMKSAFRYYISMPITNLLLLLTSNNIELYYLSYKDTILALYFVRHSQCYNEENKVVKEIYCSYKTQECSKAYFKNGFQLLLHTMQQQSSDCIIENVGHTIWLVDWLKVSGYIQKTEKYLVGYYLYNYLHKTVKTNELCVNL